MLPYLLIFLAFLADRLSKWWATAYLAERGPVTYSFFTLDLTYNTGIAFGLFQGIGPLVGWLTIGVVAGLLVYLARLPRPLFLLRCGLALIIGGALGNLVDRVLVGEVLDFISTPYQRTVFNVADISINLGLVLAVVGSYLKQPSPEEAKSE